MVADALRLMQARDEVAAIKRARLQDAIDRGYEDIAAGKVISIQSDDQSTPSSPTCEASRICRDCWGRFELQAPPPLNRFKISRPDVTCRGTCGQAGPRRGSRDSVILYSPRRA